MLSAANEIQEIPYPSSGTWHIWKSGGKDFWAHMLTPSLKANMGSGPIFVYKTQSSSSSCIKRTARNPGYSDCLIARPQISGEASTFHDNNMDTGSKPMRKANINFPRLSPVWIELIVQCFFLLSVSLVRLFLAVVCLRVGTGRGRNSFSSLLCCASPAQSPLIFF